MDDAFFRDLQGFGSSIAILLVTVVEQLDDIPYNTLVSMTMHI